MTNNKICFTILIFQLSIVLFLSSCNLITKPKPSEIALKQQQIIVGAERTHKYFPSLRNKNIAVLVNQTSMVEEQHLVDVLDNSDANLKFIFAPEHGFRGNKGAGEEILDGVDDNTGTPIFSLHGNIKKPTPEQLKNIDILVFDIQDVGVRYYTYISSMHYLMEACAENSIPLLILDRPNPNGDRVNGPVLDLNYQSFVGMHPIPLLHGMTVAEIALMINGEGWLANNNQCRLSVVKIKNYTHHSDYSLPIAPSPNLPNDLSVFLYPALGLFEGTDISVGRGTSLPFQVLGYPSSKMGDFTFSPKKISGSWSQLNYAGEELYGEKIQAKDIHNSLLEPLLRWHQKFKNNRLNFFTRSSFFDKLAGGPTLRLQIEAGKTAVEIEQSWQHSLFQFRKLRSKYLLYPE